LATFPAIRQSEPLDSTLWQGVSVCERAAALGLLAAGAPLMAGCAAAVWLISGRSPWIAHRRVGWRGSDLWMFKLRTMWDAGDTMGGARWVEYIDEENGPGEKAEHDPRVSSAFCRFCRRHSLDELPQLWHVLRGDMALIGPRPLTRGELERYYGPDTPELLELKPGLAGLWQVSGRNRLTYSERRALDLRFVRERSARMYFAILARTVVEIWRGANTW